MFNKKNYLLHLLLNQYIKTKLLKNLSLTDISLTIKCEIVFVFAHFNHLLILILSHLNFFESLILFLQL